MKTQLDFTLLNSNIEGLDKDTLLELGRAPLGVRPVAQARLVFPDRPKGYVETFRSLKHYAMNKAVAMNERESGRIASAREYELICDWIYNRLPEYARW